MAVFIKFNKFIKQMGEKNYALSTDILKVALTNTEPTITDSVFLSSSLHPPPVNANGYPSGGYRLSNINWVDNSGVATLECIEDIIIVASSGGIGPFRYAILYDSTTTSPLTYPLIGYWDYGSSITLNANETFVISIVSNLLIIS